MNFALPCVLMWGMEGMDPQTIIAVIALMTGLGYIFNLLLKPVKNNQARFEKSLDSLEAMQTRFEKKLDSLEVRQTHFEKRMDNLEAGQTSLEKKLDQLLARN